MFNAAAFVRRSGAYWLGHVGWAFALDAATFDDGSVENPAGTPYTPPSEDGFWECKVGADKFVGPFVPYGYDHYKVLTAPNPNPGFAQQIVSWISTQPYVVIGQNCMDDVYDVLRAFGVPDLPIPALEVIPNWWFDALPGNEIPVSKDAGAWLYGPEGPAEEQVFPPISPRPSIGYPPFPPSWRTPGTAEFAEFQIQISQPVHRRARRRGSSPAKTQRRRKRG
jgi:hypothetical protein